MEDSSDDTPQQTPESLLPYDVWTEEALRHVVVQALAYIAAEGMPDQHHFYITFRTDLPGVAIPPRLRAQYPHEMTIVLQHQFWDVRVDEEAEAFSVVLSFGGVSSTLNIPFAAVTAFADPHVQFGLRFQVRAEPANEEGDAPVVAPEPEPAPPAPAESQVVSLDAFRKRPSKE